MPTPPSRYLCTNQEGFGRDDASIHTPELMFSISSVVYLPGHNANSFINHLTQMVPYWDKGPHLFGT